MFLPEPEFEPTPTVSYWLYGGVVVGITSLALIFML